MNISEAAYLVHPDESNPPPQPYDFAQFAVYQPAQEPEHAEEEPDQEPVHPQVVAVDVARNRIIEAFPVKPDVTANVRFWEEQLSDSPKWLRVARTFPGKRGIPARWNPLLVARALLGRNYMTRKALDKVMREQFPGQLDEWREQTLDAAR